MMNDQTKCSHQRAIPMTPAHRLAQRAELISHLDQLYPDYPADEIAAVADSAAFDFAICPDCDTLIQRLA